MKTMYNNTEPVNMKIRLKYPQILMRILTEAQQFKNFEPVRTNIFIFLAIIISGLGFSQTKTARLAPAGNSQKIEKMSAVETPTIGETKNDTQSADHNGWYLINGRAITDLPVTLQKKATTLGFKEYLSDVESKAIGNTNAENPPSPKSNQPLNPARSGSVSGRSGSVSGKSTTVVVSDVTSNRFIYLGE